MSAEGVSGPAAAAGKRHARSVSFTDLKQDTCDVLRRFESSWIDLILLSRLLLQVIQKFLSSSAFFAGPRSSGI